MFDIPKNEMYHAQTSFALKNVMEARVVKVHNSQTRLNMVTERFLELYF